MNPATVSLEKAQLLRCLGVNRISMGVQSWDEELLKVLGRVHNTAQAERSYGILREAGFQNVNLDLIFAVPLQTRQQWQASLEKTIALRPEHISAYCLTYEEDTEYLRRFESGEFQQDEDRDADLFEMTMDSLGSAGYEQYEISNYAKPDHECRHNLAYWLGANYLGFGPSAFSTVGTRRWKNHPDTALYCDCILSSQCAESFSEILTPRVRAAERIAFSLRTNRGIPRAMLGPWEGEVAQFQADGFFEAVADSVVLTRRGRLVADALAETFI